MGIFKCLHKYKIIAKSNAIRMVEPGIWERLCKCECEKCGKIEELWIDSASVTGYLEDVSKFVRLEWEKGL